jgi:uncharacterized RDD family membrane protein YckC
MRCPSCGAITLQDSLPCSECGAIHDKDLTEQVQLTQTDAVEEPAPTKTRHKAQPARSLIEFPGAAKNSKPQWRKELGERVREVQERRAREAMFESGVTEAEVEDNQLGIPLLELLPRTEAPPVNPIVVAALERIERAHVQSRYSRHAAVATMLAYDEPTEYGLEVSASITESAVSLQEEPDFPAPRPERTHNLAVVPPQIVTDSVICELEPVDTPVIEDPPVPEPTRKPKRLIGDLNDPALNYLDSIPVAICVDAAQRRAAPVFLRMFSAILDLVFVALLSSPVVALVKLTDLKWQDSRTIGFAIGTYIVIGFLYLTIATAFTGRTLGMKLFCLRVVDARTGLIPTGGQSVARAVLYLLSLASAGIALLYTLVDSERYAAHDRITRTAVVRV